MIGLSAEAEDWERVRRAILLLSGYDKRLPERAESAAEVADALRHLTPCPTWSEPDVECAARERHQAARVLVL